MPSTVLNAYKWRHSDVIIIKLIASIQTHNHFMALFPGLPGWAGDRNLLLDLMVQGKITETDTDHPTGCHSIWTNQQSNTIILAIFMPDALIVTTLPLYPGLGQAPNMLGYILRGMIKYPTKNVFLIFHILKINRIMLFCNLFTERLSYLCKWLSLTSCCQNAVLYL